MSTKEIMLIIVNCAGTILFFAWYNIWKNKIEEKKEIRQYIAATFFYFVMITGFVLAFPTRSGIAIVGSNYLTYLLCITVVTKQNLFYSFCDMTVSMIQTIIVSILFSIVFSTVVSGSMVEFRLSIFWNIVYVLMNGLIYYLFAIIFKRKGVEVRNNIWASYKELIRPISLSLVLLVGWITLFFSMFKADSILQISNVIGIAFAVFSFVSGMVIAYFVFMIVKQKKEFEELETIAKEDILTGVMNRRYGLKYLEREMRTVKSNKGKLILCFLDINNLKEINDNLGHENGDELIKLVIEIIEEGLLYEDKIIRYGGDEFLILFSNGELGDLESKMKQLLSQVNQRKPKSFMDYEVSFSYGLVEYEGQSSVTTVEALIHEADQKMYQFKRNYKEKNVRMR